jgi:hypothetical protein
MNTAKPPPLPGQRSVAVAQPRKVSRWELVFRVAIIGSLVISTGMAWWTLTRRLMPLQQQSQALGVTVSHLSDEVDALQRKWPPADVERIRNGYKELRTQLFADEGALQAWLARLDEAAGPLVLDLKVDFGKPTAQVTNDVHVSVMPASVAIEVHPMPGGTESPYQRLLRFGQQLGTEGKRADLAELKVLGGTSSITRALLVFNLWAGEETPENKSASAR